MNKNHLSRQTTRRKVEPQDQDPFLETLGKYLDEAIAEEESQHQAEARSFLDSLDDWTQRQEDDQEDG